MQSEKITQEITNDTNSTQEQTETVQDQANILEIDLDKITIKDLAEFRKDDLLTLGKNIKAFQDLKDWQINRLGRPVIAKRIKEKHNNKSAAADTTKKTKEVESEANPEDQEYIVIFQNAITDLLTKSDPTNLDLFCVKTLENNDTTIIEPENAEKIKRFALRFSMVHLAIRNFGGGYLNLWEKSKEFYTKYKERKNAN